MSDSRLGLVEATKCHRRRKRLIVTRVGDNSHACSIENYGIFFSDLRSLFLVVGQSTAGNGIVRMVLFLCL